MGFGLNSRLSEIDAQNSTLSYKQAEISPFHEKDPEGISLKCVKSLRGQMNY